MTQICSGLSCQVSTNDLVKQFTLRVFPVHNLTKVTKENMKISKLIFVEICVMLQVSSGRRNSDLRGRGVVIKEEQKNNGG